MPSVTSCYMQAAGSTPLNQNPIKSPSHYTFLSASYLGYKLALLLLLYFVSISRQLMTSLLPCKHTHTHTVLKLSHCFFHLASFDSLPAMGRALCRWNRKKILHCHQGPGHWVISTQLERLIGKILKQCSVNRDQNRATHSKQSEIIRQD